MRIPILRYAPGLVACAVAVILSIAIHLLVPTIPAMTSAVILGILTANLPMTRSLVSGRLRPGLIFAGKHLMRAGIVVLGLKLSIVDIMELGWTTFGIVIAVVALSFVGTYGLGRLFRLPGDAPLLIAAGFSICGASAIGAMAAARRSKDEETVLPVALVTLCGTLAIGLFPLLMSPLALAPVAYGQWVGASVHDVGQVVATAQVAGGSALASALVIKLTRVLLLAPIVSLAAIAGYRRDRSQTTHTHHGAETPQLPSLVPLFIIGFLVMIGIRSLGVLSDGSLEAAAVVQDILLGSALFGLGCGVNVRELVTSGARAGGTALCSWFLIAALGYGAVQLISL